jgi:ABC-type multidrug transport system fused ATPase/permease subunit
MQIDKFAEIIRSMNQHEDTLRAQRIQLLMSAQAILFAATGIMWQYNLVIVVVISLLGISFSSVIYSSLFDGHLAREELKRIWGKRQEIEVKKLKKEAENLKNKCFLFEKNRKQEEEKLNEKRQWPPVFALEYTTELDKEPENGDKVRCQSFEPESKDRKTSKNSNVGKNIRNLLIVAWAIILILALLQIGLAVLPIWWPNSLPSWFSDESIIKINSTIKSLCLKCPN